VLAVHPFGGAPGRRRRAGAVAELMQESLTFRGSHRSKTIEGPASFIDASPKPPRSTQNPAICRASCVVNATGYAFPIRWKLRDAWLSIGELKPERSGASTPNWGLCDTHLLHETSVALMSTKSSKDARITC
jgi:hypothetical protein